MACPLRTASALVALFESVARLASYRPVSDRVASCGGAYTVGAYKRRRFAVEGARLLPGFCFALQLACNVDDRNPVTSENAIQSSGGTAGASGAAAMTPAAGRGSAGATEMGSGGAPNRAEELPVPRPISLSDAGVTSSPTVTAPPPDAASTASEPPPPPVPPPCDTGRPFQAPVLVQGLASSGDEYGLWLAPDELTAYFASNRGDLGGPGDYDLYRAKRATTDAAFEQPSLVPLVNSAFTERKAVLSSDGLRLFFSSNRPGLGTGDDIYVAVRPNTSSEFGVPGLLSGINSNQGDLVHSITSDGRYLYFDHPVAGAGRDIFLFDLTMSTATKAVTEIESPYDDGHAVTSADGLTLYWATTRVSLADGDGSAESDIWSARRASLTDPLGSLTPVAELNTSSAETVHYVSTDGCRIYIGSERSGRAQLYVAAKP